MPRDLLISYGELEASRSLSRRALERVAGERDEFKKAMLELLLNTPNFLRDNAPHVAEARRLLRPELDKIYRPTALHSQGSKT